MNKLEKLISELCPNGVEYKPIGELIVKAPKSSSGVGNIALMNKGNIKAFTSGNKSFFVDKYLVDGEYIYMNDGGQADVKYGFGKAYYSDHVFAFTSNVMNVRFLFHYLLKISDLINKDYFRGGGIKNLVKVDFMKIEIPVPPKEVQDEIVRILDNFTNLTAELTAELTARKKQYDYYSEKFFSEIQSPIFKISDICSVYDGIHQTPKYKAFGIPFVSVENIEDIYSTTKFISTEDFAKYKVKPQKNDVFMTRITAGIIGKCFVIEKDIDIAYYVSLALLRPNINLILPKYLKLYIESGYGKKELDKYILHNATPPKINKDAIGMVMIKVPTLSEQRKIVSILDSFYNNCNDIKDGLPLEIELRQKQYEYYRDKLLNFKRLEV